VSVLRPLAESDWPAVARIYAEGILDGDATFESDVPGWEHFDETKVPAPRLVAQDADGAIEGWVAASAISTRAVYRGVIEHSVYVARTARGRGVGRALLLAFLEAAEQEGFWTVQSSIFVENTASLRLHRSCGFRVVGRRERIARAVVGPHAGRWRDTLLLERRSRTLGAD